MCVLSLQRLSAGVYAPQLLQWRSQRSCSQLLVLTTDTASTPAGASDERRRLQMQVSEFLGVPLTQPPSQLKDTMPEEHSSLPSLSCALHDAVNSVYSQWNEVLYAMEPQLERFTARLPCTEAFNIQKGLASPLIALGCEAKCDRRNMAWYRTCGGAVQPWEATLADCRACALCPDVRSPKTLNRTHEPAPHGGMINGGTVVEAIGLLQQPRQSCVIEHWPGWIEAIHYFSLWLSALEESMFWVRATSPLPVSAQRPTGYLHTPPPGICAPRLPVFAQTTPLRVSAHPPSRYLHKTFLWVSAPPLFSKASHSPPTRGAGDLHLRALAVLPLTFVLPPHPRHAPLCPPIITQPSLTMFVPCLPATVRLLFPLGKAPAREDALNLPHPHALASRWPALTSFPSPPFQTGVPCRPPTLRPLVPPRPGSHLRRRP
jgi:hypothetical protein